MTTCCSASVSVFNLCCASLAKRCSSNACSRSCRGCTLTLLAAAEGDRLAKAGERVQGGEREASMEGARWVLREDAALAKLLVGGEKATRGDFVPAVARSIWGEEEASDALRTARPARDVGAAAGDTEVLGSARRAKTARGSLAVP